ATTRSVISSLYSLCSSTRRLPVLSLSPYTTLFRSTRQNELHHVRPKLEPLVVVRVGRHVVEVEHGHRAPGGRTIAVSAPRKPHEPERRDRNRPTIVHASAFYRRMLHRPVCPARNRSMTPV